MRYGEDDALVEVGADYRWFSDRASSGLSGHLLAVDYRSPDQLGGKAGQKRYDRQHALLLLRDDLVKRLGAKAFEALKLAPHIEFENRSETFRDVERLIGNTVGVALDYGGVEQRLAFR